MFLALLDVTEDIVNPIISVVTIGAIAIVMLLVSVKIMERALPFSVRHELEEDHNVAAAVVMSSIIIGVSIVIAAVAKG